MEAEKQKRAVTGEMSLARCDGFVNKKGAQGLSSVKDAIRLFYKHSAL